MVRSCQNDDFVNHHSGKVVCFEQIVLSILNNNDCAFIHKKIQGNPDCDKTMKAIFNNPEMNEESITEGLKSYINDLRAKGSPFLADGIAEG